MIESCYWKSDLLKHARRLRSVKKPQRWSEKLAVDFEKELIISFFMIRKLFEGHKLSSKSQKHRVRFFACPATKKQITNLNYAFIDDIYHLEKEKSITKDIVFVCNQFIHSGAMFAYREKNRNWGGVYVCSDFERRKSIYRIPLAEIRAILNVVGTDYPQEITMTYNKKIGDYAVTTN